MLKHSWVFFFLAAVATKEVDNLFLKDVASLTALSTVVHVVFFFAIADLWTTSAIDDNALIKE